MENRNINTFLSNSELSIQVKAHGAELCSIQRNGTEYLWQADPAFWKRHSPVLFPIVGSVWEGRYRVDGQEYLLSQHGFARDMDFELIQQTNDEVWYRLTNNDETMSKYPYPFILEIGYHIEGSKINVMWRVKNPSQKIVDFQIGAHPAFYYHCKEGAAIKGYFSFGEKKNLFFRLISEKGCADVEHLYSLQLDQEKMLEINTDTFAKDALIFEDSQLKEVSLLDENRNPYLKLNFNSPLVGLWAPSPSSPFVCIEPWYGRCDRAGFTGEFKDRDWMQHLQPQGTFEGGYSIEIL